MLASQWLHSGFAGIFAGLVGFTLRSSWPCVHCACFAVAAPCLRNGFALASQSGVAGVFAGLAGFTLPSSWPCVHRASFAVAAPLLRSVFAVATHKPCMLALALQASRCVRPGLVFIALASQWLRPAFVTASHWLHRVASQAYLPASQASRCNRPGLVLIALASQWLRSCLVTNSQCLHAGF
jgi:hypothetical protein